MIYSRTNRDACRVVFFLRSVKWIIQLGSLYQFYSWSLDVMRWMCWQTNSRELMFQVSLKEKKETTGCSEGRASSWPIVQSSWPAAEPHSGERVGSERGSALWQGGLGDLPQDNLPILVLFWGIFKPLRYQMHRNLFLKWCILRNFCIEGDEKKIFKN